MKKKSFLYSLLLVLVFSGLTLNGCNKDNEEDVQLGASRPLPNMLSDISVVGAISYYNSYIK